MLVVAWFLAVLSAFFVKPGPKYFEYIDFKTLGILWSLMIIMEGLSSNGLFKKVGSKLLNTTKTVRQLAMTLVLVCFFSSMFITNDVALITFVPFSMMILEECNKQKIMIPIIVLQTIAANLGSMLTPIGNPQNLYLYGIWGANVITFVKTLLPYTATLSVVSGRETVIGIIASQVISNVPTALLLSGFTTNFKELLIGVNIGGLGTLIASMASLISYKLYAHKNNETKGKYIVFFTLINLVFLIILLVVKTVAQRVVL